MTGKCYTVLLISLGCSLALQASASHPDHHLSPPACPQGCKVVEETCYKEVCRDVCKPVPEVKKIKKWVYSCKDDPFCIPTGGPNACGLHGCGKKDCGKCEHGHDGHGCPSCKGPYARNRLVKREIVVEEIVSTKCVVEKVTETVAYTVYRIVPCSETPNLSAPGVGSPPGVKLPPTEKSMPPASLTTPAPSAEVLSIAPGMLPSNR